MARVIISEGKKKTVLVNEDAAKYIASKTSAKTSQKKKQPEVKADA